MKNWAVIGTGTIANKFVEDAQHGQDGRFVAVYSRDRDRAESFAKQHGLEHAYDSLESLLDNPDIDIVYVASPHVSHADHAIAAMEAGKAVLVEKPIATSATQAERIYETARRNEVFCQEALWTRFHPAYQDILGDARDGRLGNLKHTHSNFGFIAPSEPEHRLNNPELGGGALLDIGIYPLLLPLDLFGEPEDIEGHVAMGSTGVDVSADLVLRYADGQRASVSYSLDTVLPTTATISGDEGWVEIQSPWFAPDAARWQSPKVAGPTNLRHYPVVGSGYHYEFTAVNAYVDVGALESVEHNWERSTALMRVLDRIRKRWGPTYPFEAKEG